MTTKWDAQAERQLCLAAHMSDSNVKIDWAKTHEQMVGLGYNFTLDAMRQRWTKVIIKQHKQAVAAGGGAGSGAAASNSGPSTPVNTRKRSAPASSGKKTAGTATARTPGGRGNQATVQMANAAYAHDNGGDDDEEFDEVKPPVSKRAKTGAGPATGLHGQSFDLTEEGNGDEVEITQVNQALGPPLVKKEVKKEESAAQNGNSAAFIDPSRAGRDRSCTMALDENPNGISVGSLFHPRTVSPENEF
ncbi:hypothetical protein CkaCkLH20_04877 [Colletotrichum karsti]|uniref:Myb-like domain-containing protein n=1 Tax=Colletotrichum karsti TaxID=1095194 RepID=A0A9P6LMQ2_9PEZI|nr:uncharacterized protein CkaCkLH20_04877 [Colletotrichum karsti]KAF9877742.1 hypothetical protein CkaCkLH20_04877 [Colletotrichum karsti]